MDWISKLEKKYGKYAVADIMKYVIMLQAGGFILRYIDSSFYYSYLSMDAAAIFRGEVWRVVTFLMDPPSTSAFFIFFVLYLYYMIGQSLERVWGSFRFNLYLLSGILFHVLASLLAYLVTGYSFPVGTVYLYLSLFFAFATLYPNTQFMLFFIVPCKVKYLAWFNGAFFGYTVLQGILPMYAQSYYGIIYQGNAISAFVSLLNFILFYFGSKMFRKVSSKEMKRIKKYQRDLKKAVASQKTYDGGAKHKCHVCGKTELDDETLEFRYCSKCSGNKEYCQEHLFTHEHK